MWIIYSLKLALDEDWWITQKKLSLINLTVLSGGQPQTQFQNISVLLKIWPCYTPSKNEPEMNFTELDPFWCGLMEIKSILTQAERFIFHICKKTSVLVNHFILLGFWLQARFTIIDVSNALYVTSLLNVQVQVIMWHTF